MDNGRAHDDGLGSTAPRRCVPDAHVGNRPELVQRFIGCKVTVSTRDFHYAVGILRGLDPSDVLQLTVAGRPVAIPRAALVSIREADAALAEYVK